MKILRIIVLSLGFWSVIPAPVNAYENRIIADHSWDSLSLDMKEAFNQLTEAERFQIQENLKSVPDQVTGEPTYNGEIDGKWGKRTFEAIMDVLSATAIYTYDNNGNVIDESGPSTISEVLQFLSQAQFERFSFYWEGREGDEGMGECEEDNCSNQENFLIADYTSGAISELLNNVRLNWNVDFRLPKEILRIEIKADYEFDTSGNGTLRALSSVTGDGSSSYDFEVAAGSLERAIRRNPNPIYIGDPYRRFFLMSQVHSIVFSALIDPDIIKLSADIIEKDAINIFISQKKMENDRKKQEEQQRLAEENRRANDQESEQLSKSNEFLISIDKTVDNADLLEALEFLMTGDTGWEQYGITSYDLKSCKFRYVISDPINKPNIPPSFEYDFNNVIWSSSSFEQIYLPEYGRYSEFYKVNCNQTCDVMHTQHVSKQLALMMMMVYGFPSEKNFIKMELPRGISQQRFSNALSVVERECPGVKSKF